jgi:peptidyl-prolyl cis-trans isomerase SurA
MQSQKLFLLAAALGLTLQASPLLAQSNRVVTLDRIVAIVNDEVITQYDLEDQKKVVMMQLQRQGTELPPNDLLDKQLLERLINDRAQIQWAKDTGIKIDDAQVERAIGRIAEDNKMTAAQFRDLLKQDGIPFPKFREDLRNEITLARVREREVDNKISVTENRDRQLPRHAGDPDRQQQEYRISHILVLLPNRPVPTRSTHGAAARKMRSRR